MVLACAALSPSAHAVQFMDLQAPGLLIGADSLRQDLDLTANQQTLWQQSASKAQTVLRTRKLRRDRLQAQLGSMLATGVAELRDLNRLVEAEEATGTLENQQLRELWLTVNDALADKQRQRVNALLLSQLERVDAQGMRGPGGPAGREGGKRPGGGAPGGRGPRPGSGGGVGASAGFGG